jgi:hypothetical protein
VQFSLSWDRIGIVLQVECDHIDPAALGGLATLDNIRATCRGHNLLAARQVFGDAFMDRFMRRRRKPFSPHTSQLLVGADVRGWNGERDAGAEGAPP